MSLKYGLNVKKPAAKPVRRTILDDEDGEDEGLENGRDSSTAIEEISNFNSTDAPLRPPPRKLPTTQTKPPSRLNKNALADRQDISSTHAAQTQIRAAESVDPNIFDYDSFYDAKASVTEAKKAAERQDAIDRKPKYIENLLDAAARRKQDLQLAKEKMLQKEREKEGDEFADKEKFVTGAYKAQQEESRRLEEEEKNKLEAEEAKRRKMGGGMQGFYKNMMEQRDQQHQEAMEAAAKMAEKGVVGAEEKKEKSDAEIAAELKAKGVDVHINEEGQFVDKRELLSAGLNVAPSGKSGDGRGSDHLRTSARPAQSAFQNRNEGNKQAQRERQSRMMEEQLAAQVKRAREEEEEEKERLERAAKSTKTETDVSDARARYLARKAAKERGEG